MYTLLVLSFVGRQSQLAFKLTPKLKRNDYVVCLVFLRSIHVM